MAATGRADAEDGEESAKTVTTGRRGSETDGRRRRRSGDRTGRNGAETMRRRRRLLLLLQLLRLDLYKREWVWGLEKPPPGGKNPSSRGRRSGDEGGGADLDQELCYHVRIRREAETLDVLDSPKWGIYST